MAWAWASLGETVVNGGLGLTLLGDMVANGGLSELVTERGRSGRRRNKCSKRERERERERHERQRLEREFINLKLYHSATVTGPSKACLLCFEGKI